ncbi:MAG TPA: hypothetical protein VGI40_05180 [Pirellulaceae bacterium]
MPLPKPSFDFAVWGVVWKDLKLAFRDKLRLGVEGPISFLIAYMILAQFGSADAAWDLTLEKALAVPLGLFILMVIHGLWSWATAPRRVYYAQQAELVSAENQLRDMRENADTVLKGQILSLQNDNERTKQENAALTKQLKTQKEEARLHYAQELDKERSRLQKQRTPILSANEKAAQELASEPPELAMARLETSKSKLNEHAKRGRSDVRTGEDLKLWLSSAKKLLEGYVPKQAWRFQGIVCSGEKPLTSHERRALNDAVTLLEVLQGTIKIVDLTK